MGEAQNGPFQLSFNASLKVDFQGSRVTSDGGLILVRELNDVSVTLPPSAGVSLDLTVGAPNGPSIPVQFGVGKNASIGTFITLNGPLLPHFDSRPRSEYNLRHELAEGSFRRKL